MHVPLLITVIGPDRPGLVDLIARTVADHDGNWMESRMAHLGGHFAGIVRVQVPGDRQEALGEALSRLQPHGVKVSVERDSVAPLEAPQPSVVLELLGHDRPGIVRQISAVLAARGVNVEELETGCESAPMTGETLFRARALLRLPSSCPPSELQEELERLAGELMVDLRLRPLEPSAGSDR